jgi:5S rRNA maturation endonuclease (ribonuclease M5)
MENTKLTKKKIVVVEGKDEVSFLDSFFKHHFILDTEAVNFEGKDDFSKKIKLLAKRSGFETVEKLILIRDADFGENASQNTFRSLQNALKEAELPFPKQINEFTASKGLQTAIYIMPFAQLEGMFEDLLLESLAESEKKCIELFFECMNRSIAKKDMPKAKIQAFLSTQVPPKRDFVGSMSDQTKYWDWDHECFDSLKKLLKQ